MTQPGKSFFRAGALERFIKGRTRLVLPEFVSPRGFVLLWCVVGLVLAGGALALSAEVPRFQTGVAIVVDGGAGEAPRLLAFLPPDTLPELKTGQTLFLEQPAATRRAAVPLALPILEVAPEVLGPAAARARFALDTLPARALAGPSALVFARFEPREGKPSDYLGSVYPVNVRVGSERLSRWLPFAGGRSPE